VPPAATRRAGGKKLIGMSEKAFLNRESERIPRSLLRGSSKVSALH
jgi:hypothetical protein